MDIKNYLLSKKPRRSDRLLNKDRNIQDCSRKVEHDRLLNKDRNVQDCSRKVEHLHHSPLGYFDLIPVELKFNVFQFLSIEDLSILTITSKAMRNLIEGYRVTRFSGPHCFSYKDVHVLLPKEQQTEILGKYRKLGLLIKRSTCLYATKDRLKIINEFLTRIYCYNTDLCTDPSRCIALLCFGKFLHTVIAGWDDSECKRAFEAISNHMNMLKCVKSVVNSKPGALSFFEGTVRIFFRRIFLDPSLTVPERIFWISCILEPFSVVSQARLLYILYTGHFSGGEIQWHEMSESTPMDNEHSSIFFGSLSSILQLLHLPNTEWKNDTVIEIIDEITNTPEDWLVENIAGLLLACGECITTKMLVSKVLHGRFAEVASILTSLCLVSVKHNYNLSQVMTVLDCLIEVIENPSEKLQLLHRIYDTFKELIFDTHEFTDSDDANDNEFFYHVSAMTEFSKRMAQLAFKHVIPQPK